MIQTWLKLLVLVMVVASDYGDATCAPVGYLCAICATYLAGVCCCVISDLDVITNYSGAVGLASATYHCVTFVGGCC